MIIQVENGRSRILGGDEFILDVLNKELRYPTNVANARGEHTDTPESGENKWDGWARLLNRPKHDSPWFPTGLLQRTERIVRKMGYDVLIDDKRQRPPEGMPELVNIPLRDYQKDAVREAIRAGRGVLDMPPRAGKTRTMCEINRAIGLRNIWIAPTDRIVRQTVEVLEGFFGQHYVTHLIGSKNWKEASRDMVVICTAATAALLPKEFYDTREMICVDEWHHCLGSTTLVLTDKGERAISEIKPGDLVWSRGKRAWELKPVVHVWEYPAPDIMYRVTTTVGILEVTGEHKIYTEKGKRAVKDLRVGGTVYMREVRESNFQKRAVRWACSGLLRAKEALSGLRKLWKENSKEVFRWPSDELSWEESIKRSGCAQEGDGGPVHEYGISEASVGSDARRKKPGKKKRRKGQIEQGMEGIYAHPLWSGSWGEREGRDKYGTGGGEVTDSSGVHSRVSDKYRDERAGWSSFLFNRFCRYFQKNSGRGGRLQPCGEARTGQKERRFSIEPGLGGFSVTRGLSGGGFGMAPGRIESIEIIPPVSETVFDLEVEGNHNYLANGILVSNSAAKSYKAIFKMCDHIFYRYGMTGTFFRSGADAMAMHALLSQAIYTVSSKDLLDRGYLVPTHVAFMPVPGKRLQGVSGMTFQSGHGKLGIHEHQARNHLVCGSILSLRKSGKKVLVLVGTKVQGRLIRGILNSFVPASPMGAEFNTVEFVSTDVDRKKQGHILKSFESDQEVKILIGTSLLGEGVDLPTADALVYARGEKAEVTLTQNMYRVGTAVPEKNYAIVVDFADKHNAKLFEHSQERLRIYFEEPTFDVSVLSDLREFESWLQKVPTF